MKISIGLLSYKRTDLLVETLKDISKVNTEIDLIIVNNNEDMEIFDDIRFIVDNKNINLKYIWDKVNYGVAHGRNKIVENLKTDYLIILDDDVYIEDLNKVISNTIKVFEAEKDVGALAFHIKDYKTKQPSRYEIPHKNKNIDMSKDFYTYLVIGAGHAIRKTILDEVGAYPEDFGLYGMEEIDLAFRIVGNGHKIKFLTDNIVFHKKSPDGRFENQEVNYRYFVNKSKIALKYLSVFYIMSTVFVWSLFFMYKTKNFKFLFKGWNEILAEKNNRAPFNNGFYKYIRRVNGFIYY